MSKTVFKKNWSWRRRRGTTCCALLVALATGGCADNAPQPPVSSSAEMIEQALASARLSADAAKESNQASSADEIAVPPTFEPPFPDRHELFFPPGNVDPAIAVAASRRSSGVVLKGFVRVRGLRALVDIDAEVAVLQEGNELSGVRLVSLQPPEATFQRRKRQWKASLW